jgi:hypothetical protein
MVIGRIIWELWLRMQRRILSVRANSYIHINSKVHCLGKFICSDVNALLCLRVGSAATAVLPSTSSPHIGQGVRSHIPVCTGVQGKRGHCVFLAREHYLVVSVQPLGASPQDTGGVPEGTGGSSLRSSSRGRPSIEGRGAPESRKETAYWWLGRRVPRVVGCSGGDGRREEASVMGQKHLGSLLVAIDLYRYLPYVVDN